MHAGRRLAEVANLRLLRLAVASGKKAAVYGNESFRAAEWHHGVQRLVRDLNIPVI